MVSRDKKGIAGTYTGHSWYGLPHRFYITDPRPGDKKGSFFCAARANAYLKAVNNLALIGNSGALSQIKNYYVTNM